MNKRRLSASKQLTLGAMVAALTILCLYAASVLPTGKIALYFLSSVFVYVLACEGAYGSAFAAYLASASLAFLLLPNKLPAIVYALFLGHYGIFRTAIHSRLSSRVFMTLLKLLYCDIFCGLALYICNLVFGEIPVSAPAWLPVWALVLFVQAGFILFDVLYGLAIVIYESRLRRSMVPRR